MQTKETRLALVIVGAGFAGVWAALAAARRRRAVGAPIAITVVAPTDTFELRPRLHEAELGPAAVELRRLLEPVEVEHRRARVTAIDPTARRVWLDDGVLAYDAVVVAAGSTLAPARWPGARAPRAASIDDLAAAQDLGERLRSLASVPRPTLAVIGAGLTGVELATSLAGRRPDARIVLVERGETVAPGLGPRARAAVVAALTELGIETRLGAAVVAAPPGALVLASGEELACDLVVGTSGVRPSPLVTSLGAVDELGRVRVDGALRVEGRADVWAAGDVAAAHRTAAAIAPMTCQHAIPQGKLAGHNAVSWLAGRPLRTYAQHLLLTCVDLGSAGAVVALGDDRDDVIATGAAGKAVKRYLLDARLCPPPDAPPAALLRAARPVTDGALEARLTGALFRVGAVRRLVVGGGASRPGERACAAVRA